MQGRERSRPCSCHSGPFWTPGSRGTTVSSSRTFPSIIFPTASLCRRTRWGSSAPRCSRKYYLGELKAFSERYGCIGIHCCSNSEHQWENFLQIPDLKLLNIVQPPEVTKRSIRFFADHTAQYPSETVDISGLPERNRIHLVTSVYAETPEEAAELVTRLSERQIQSP